MSNPEVRINVSPQIESREKKNELAASPPQEQAENTAAAGNGSTEEKDKNRKSPPPRDLANDQSINEDLIINLYKAALKDDWETAFEDVFKKDPLKNSKYLTARITDEEDTALHIAVAAQSYTFAKKLVTFMEKDDLKIKNSDGETAFFLVAASGMVELAKVMYKKNKELLGIRGGNKKKMLPIHIAALNGHEEMIQFLHGVTEYITEEDREQLKDLNHGKDLFDIKFLKEFPEKLPAEEVRVSAPENELHGNTDEDLTHRPLSKSAAKREQFSSTMAATEGKIETETSAAQAETHEENKRLYAAVLRNEWFTACNSRTKGTKILTENGDTTLHIAAAAGSSNFIYFLVKYMNEEDLKTPNRDGNTAFYLGAKNGRLECVKRMLQAQKGTKLPSIRGDDNMLPIQIAAQLGYIKTVKCLYYDYYHHDKDELSEEDCKKLLPSLVCRAELLDVASDLLKNHPNLVTGNLSNGKMRKETFLHVLARTHLMSPSVSNQNQEGRFKRLFNKFYNRSNYPHEKLPYQVLDLLRDLLKKVDCREDWMHEVIAEAVNHENVEFLSLIICEHPELMICNVSRGKKTTGLIFSNAISERQNDIFDLRKRLPPLLQKQILDYEDDNGNNILHLAGKLGPPEKLDAVCGVALQLQQELMWFEEVSNMVDASKAQKKNRQKKTPKALFDKEHKQLKERSGQWMKDTANSCMIVATLIATVVFAAAFTVPGGTNEASGLPRFANELSFRFFVFADVISLVSSVWSLLTFLAIHTSRYAENDFLVKLPRKLVCGLLALLLSIASMMVVFCTAIFVVFKVENIWVRIILGVGATSPVIHFAMMKWRLLFDVTRKTFKINSILKEGKRKKRTERRGGKCKGAEYVM